MLVVYPSKLNGTLKAPASKAHAQRLLFMSALSAQSRKVFGYYRTYLSVLHISDHSLKIGSVKIRSRPAVINIELGVVKTIPLCEVQKHGFLICYTIALALQVVIVAEAAI